jgi:hypothetical protein
MNCGHSVGAKRIAILNFCVCCGEVTGPVAILLIAAVPVYAQPQNPSTAKASKGDAQKVVTIISGDKVKTQTYCDLRKLA